MSDEGFHEIQLNGKQLVFLFMAATVVSVVIFLCGVMVGRGVQTARGAGGASVEETAADAVRPIEPAAAQTGDATAPPAGDPPSPVEGDYHDRLVGGGSPSESLEPPAEQRQAPAPASASAPAPAARTPQQEAAPAPQRPKAAAAGESKGGQKAQAPPATTATAAAPSRAARTDTDPTSSGRFAVQLAALRERTEAEAIVKRLVAKGYQAYVLVPSPGAPPVYRVQVGRFSTRGEADRTAARLRKEEQFTPWVTR